MSSNEKRICEYFLISGFSDTRKPYDLSQIYKQGEEIFNTNVEITKDFFHYKEPVVDIKIVSLSDKLPEGYHVVDKTYSRQNKADLNGKSTVEEFYLCFRYGRKEPPITDIWAFYPKDKNNRMQGKWTLIEKTFSGHSANLSNSSSNPLYLAFKLAPLDAPVDNLAVTDICIILANKNELCPPAYSRVDVPIKRTPLSHTINICYKKSMVKEHVLSFQPEILYCLPCVTTEPIVDVYNPDPSMVKLESCLPDDICDVANFCMPWGATLESWSFNRGIPKPSFLTFVLTNMNYNRMYGAAVLFYEEIKQEELKKDEILSLGLDNVSNNKIFCSKSLCLLSRWPLFQTFNQVLSFLIQEDERQKSNKTLDSSPYSLPIDIFISQFLHTVAFPTPEAPNILLQWDLINPIGIQLPTHALSRFGTGENFYHLVRMLDVEQIIQLFVYMLTEQKILLTSTCNSDLTGIAEALIAMIFPFKWSVVYIPFLYLRCIHIIQSPSPYLIGVDSRFFDFFKLPEGVGCIDLITKSIKPPDTNYKYLDYLKVLPKSVLKSLRNGLSNCKTKVSSFERQQDLRIKTGNVMDEFTILRKRESIGESIRECFLRAVILMFKNYQGYLVPLSVKERHDDMFNVEGFLKSVDRNCRILYQAIFDTQLWNNFILERSYATEFDDGLAFFDRCIKSMKDMDDDTANATSLLQTDSVIKSEHTKVIPPPDPIDGWLPDTDRTTFPRRLNSHLLFPSSIHAINIINENFGDADSNTDLNYTPVLSINNEKRVEYGSMGSLSTSDSSIPTLLIVPEPTSNGLLNLRNRRPAKVSVLKRSFEEQKQARIIGKEAENDQSYAWAGHLLSSSYCLWYLSLPGLIGHIQETPGLKETGLTERVLQLGFELLITMSGHRLSLPDEVCYRVLLILIHQLRPPRLHVSEILKYAELNAFSYGLCNQIILEQEQQLSQKVMVSNTNLISPVKPNQIDSGISDMSSACKSESKDEKDCDSGRETLASTTIVPEESQDSTDVVGNIVPKSVRPSVEIGGKIIELRGKQTQKNRKNRASQLIVTSPMDLCSLDMKSNHQFFDPKAGIIMSTTNRSPTPFLAMYRSPNSDTGKSTEDSVSRTISHSQTNTVTPAIITRHPFSEERSELHSSFLTKKRSSINDQTDRFSSSGVEVVANVITSFRETNIRSDIESNLSNPRLADSRLTQSDFGADKVALKTRASFRQFKTAANKSLRSMRSMMTSMGNASWLMNPEAKPSQTVNHKALPAGLPTPFRPWSQTSNNYGTSSENRLKTTVSADLLDTMGDHNDNVQISRPCAGTVQQLRRHTNTSGSHWPNSDSYESFYSDQRFEQGSSTNSLDTEPLFAITDKVYDKITGALAAIRLPTGKFWPEDQIDGESPLPCIECSKCICVYMTTCTDCVHCHHSVYDDDIMSGWSSDDSDLQSVCPYCRHRFTPKLTFQVFISHSEGDTSKSPRSKKLSLAYTMNVNYLSPFVLRKELESVFHQEGEVALLKPDFLSEHGILYWNLMWYYSRLGLPTHLLSFLTIWLRTRGEWLVARNEENKSKYEILVTLTGYEQVFVSLFWEFSQVHGRVGQPLYHRYFRESSNMRNIVGPTHSPTKHSINEVLSKIFSNDIYGAMCSMLEMRASGNRTINGVNTLPLNTVERSIYRELYFLVTVAFENRIDFDVFHDNYNEPWQLAFKRYHNLATIFDKPPSERTLYCRRFFRPLLLSLS